MLPRFPANQRTELEAMAKASGMDADLLVFANVMYDWSRLGGCSAQMVEPARSATGGMLFGRDFDFPTFGFLDQYSLVVVYRPKEKHAFASVTFPGLVGCVSGINDAGLCLAELEVNSSKDAAPGFDPAGVPVEMCFRRMMEECKTLDEAEKLLRSLKPSTMCNLAICDKQSAAVLEITPRHIVRRPAVDSVCSCTNHFRSPELATSTQCWRYDRLEGVRNQDEARAGRHGKADERRQPRPADDSNDGLRPQRKGLVSFARPRPIVGPSAKEARSGSAIRASGREVRRTAMRETASDSTPHIETALAEARLSVRRRHCTPHPAPSSRRKFRPAAL